MVHCYHTPPKFNSSLPRQKKWWRRKFSDPFLFGAKCQTLGGYIFPTIAKDNSIRPIQVPKSPSPGFPRSWPVVSINISESGGSQKNSTLVRLSFFCVNGGGVNFLVIVLIYVHICLEGTRVIHLDIYILQIYRENTSTFRGALCNPPNVGNTSFRSA